MIASPIFRIAWLVAFAMLALGGALHSANHLHAVLDGETPHHHDAAGADSAACTHCCLEQAHSPAVLDFHRFEIFPSPATSVPSDTFNWPDAPVIEFDHPPQLS